MRKDVLRELFEEHIQNTESKSVVTDRTVILCRLTRAVSDALACEQFTKAYMNTRVLKHLYDRKPAEEFDFLTDHLHTIVKYPDRIFANKGSKRGRYCFVKQLKQENYLSSIELKKTEEGNEELYVVTAFRIRKDEKYLKGYDLLWSWKDDTPSS